MSKGELDRMAKGQKCREESSLLFTQDLTFFSINFFWLATYCKLDSFDLLHAVYQKVLINAKKLMFSEVATFKIYAYLNCRFDYAFCCF